MMEVTVMISESSEFSLQVDGVKGLCPPGEAWATQHMEGVIFQSYLAKGLVCEVISRD